MSVNTNKTKILVFQNIYKQSPPLLFNNKFLTEVKDFKFRETINYRGNFTKTTEELSKKGIKVLFSLRKYMSNFNFVPTNLSCKLFNTLIRPILTHNSEIWFMDNFQSAFMASNRAAVNNTFCDTLALAEKYPFEKVHSKFCKAVLGLKKTATNIGARSELGRFTLDSYIKTQTLMYFYRINCNDINPMVKESLQTNINLHSEGIYSWYSFADKIFKEMKINPENYSNNNVPFKQSKNMLKCNIKKCVSKEYEKNTLIKLSKMGSSSKLCLYGKLKNNCQSEEYLNCNNFIHRQLLSKFRLSDHSLGIELGRYRNIPRAQRLCKKCEVLDDEYHFFLYCDINISLRSNLFAYLKDYVPLFQHLDAFNKLKHILNPIPELVCHIGVFIKQSLELRESDPCQARL